MPNDHDKPPLGAASSITWLLLIALQLVLFAVAMIACTSLVYGEELDPQLFRWKTPTVPTAIHHRLCWSYDGRARSARWTLHYNTRETLQSPTPERLASFSKDASVPAESSPSSDDYLNTGYARGHLSESAAMRGGDLVACYRMPNIVPQDAKLNSGLWAQLERYTRNAASDGDTWTVTIPLYLPTDGVVTYRTIGKHDVAVPTHLGKSLLVLRGLQPPDLRAWIAPNAAPAEGMKIDDWIASVDELERASGLDLWAGIPDDIENKLEASK